MEPRQGDGMEKTGMDPLVAAAAFDPALQLMAQHRMQEGLSLPLPLAVGLG